jgi:Ca2+/Na+ antiporter
LLGLGNGTPDIFTTYANIRSGLYSQAFGSLIGKDRYYYILNDICKLLGAGMFVSVFIVSVVIAVKKATLNRRPFIR